MVIDCYAHHVSRRVEKIMLEKSKHFGGDDRDYSVSGSMSNADPEVRLAVMEKYGVDAQVICQTTPVLIDLGPEDAAEVCRVSNEDNYALCKAYPDKFYNVCMLSLLDVKSALEELDRSINELDCRGVTISSSQNDKGLDSPEYFPVYEKIVEHDLPILIHGTNWECSPLMDMAHSWRFLHIFGWDYDSTQAIWRLIFGGVFDRFPTMKVITHHLGNYIPFFVRRIEINFNWKLTEFLPKHISEYWGNIYGDTAVDGTPGAFPCGYAFFGAERMLYGSDYPFGAEMGEDFVRENLAQVKAMYIPDEEKEKILWKNSKKMFKID